MTPDTAGRFACALAALSLTLPGAAQDPELRARADEAIQTAESYLCEEALEQLDGVIADPGFDALPAYEIEYIHNRVVQCAQATESHERALQAVETLLAMTGQRADYLVYKVALGPLTDDPQASVAAMRRLGPEHGAMLSEFPLAMMTAIEVLLDEADESGASTLEFLDELVRTGYRPPDLLTTLGSKLLRRVRLKLQHESTAAARAAVADIRDPWALLEIKVDNRYRPLRDGAALAEALDLQRALDDWQSAHRRALTAAPRSLAAHIEYANALRLAGKPGEAIDALREAVSAVTRDGGSGYADAADTRNWLLQEYALALYDSGKPGAGAEMLWAASRIPEVDGLNFSQRDMLTRKLIEHGMVEQAMEVMRGLDEAAPNPFVNTWRRGIEACKRSAAADDEASRSELIVMRKYEEHFPGAYRRAVLCADETDLLSALLVRDLADEETRGPTLVWLQSLRPPSATGEFDGTLRARIRAAAQLPDVRAALAAAGRVVEVPFYLSTSELP